MLKQFLKQQSSCSHVCHFCLNSLALMGLEENLQAKLLRAPLSKTFLMALCKKNSKRDYWMWFEVLCGFQITLTHVRVTRVTLFLLRNLSVQSLNKCMIILEYGLMSRWLWPLIRQCYLLYNRPISNSNRVIASFYGRLLGQSVYSSNSLAIRFGYKALTSAHPKNGHY